MRKYLMFAATVILIMVLAIGCQISDSDDSAKIIMPLVDHDDETITIDDQIPPTSMSVIPNVGTTGTKITITGTGFGPEICRVYVDKCKCEILSWTDTLIEVIFTYHFSPGTYDVKVLPKIGDPIVIANSFTIVPPTLNIDAPISASVGAEVDIEGTYFGNDNSKLKVYIYSKEFEYLKWKVEVVEWSCDPTTGDSRCTFIVPIVPSGSYDIRVQNKVTWSEYYDGLNVSTCGLTLIDFDDRPTGSQLLGNEYAGLGVTLSGHWIPDWPGDPVVMVVRTPGTVSIEHYCTTGMYIQADFSVPVDYVSVEITTFENGDYDLGLTLYDDADNVVAQTITTGVNGVTYTLEAQSVDANVAYARFYGYYGTASGGVNAIRSDNLEFGIACKTKPPKPLKPPKPCYGKILIDFDDRPTGSQLLGDEYAGSGVILSGHWIPDWPVDPVVMVVRTPGTVSIEHYCTTGMYIQADFSVPVDYVSVEITTFENGDYDLGLTLYDDADNVVAQTITTGVNGVTYTLKAQSADANVAYARFYGYYGTASGGVNAVYFDNLKFGIVCKWKP